MIINLDLLIIFDEFVHNSELSDESDDGAEKFTSSIVKKFKSMDKTSK